MGTPSKDLLLLEHNKSSISPLESTLLVCKNESQPAQTKKPIIAPPPKSQLLGKMRNFLGVMSEANEKLQLDAKDNPEKYDIEALTGDESQVVSVECMLGVVDLQTPEAVAAAEAAVSGYQPVIPVENSSSGEESDDSSSDDEEESSDDNEDDESNEDKKTSSPDKINSLSEEFNNKRPKKRPKIVELS
ncbi:hypothetical protein RchiOBHm_Chr6g0247751 [Rosa chinensis]|uniref:Uncharacterized protein n=1 Tax=Rosa chinensis TaxID=74649 RepID=A0A2P6PJV4_ROSCH|nr:uncharacterized protein LOC112172852 [Rosa chinensis]PRQ22208.1 hypothetical protein RchiOBHm_Chr6g0247751 [Rosa chinensis]